MQFRAINARHDLSGAYLSALAEIKVIRESAAACGAG